MRRTKPVRASARLGSGVNRLAGKGSHEAWVWFYSKFPSLGGVVPAPLSPRGLPPSFQGGRPLASYRAYTLWWMSKAFLGNEEDQWTATGGN